MSTLTIADDMKVLLINPVTKSSAVNIRAEGTENTVMSGYGQLTIDKWSATDRNR